MMIEAADGAGVDLVATTRPLRWHFDPAASATGVAPDTATRRNYEAVALAFRFVG